MSDFLEGAQVGHSMVQSVFDEYRKGRELKERMKERHDAVELAAAEKHHQLNKEAAEASRQTEQDITKSSQWNREQTETERHNLEMEKVGKERADKYGGSGHTDEDTKHFKFVEGRLKSARAAIQAHVAIGTKPPPEKVSEYNTAVKGYLNYGKSHPAWDIEDVPLMAEEAAPAQKPGLFRQGLNAVEGMFSPAPARTEQRYDLVHDATPGQSWRDYQK